MVSPVTNPERRSRLFSTLAIVIVLVMFSVMLVFILDSNSTSHRLDRGFSANTCRATFSARVTTANTDLTTNSTSVARDNAAIQRANNELIRVIATASRTDTPATMRQRQVRLAQITREATQASSSQIAHLADTSSIIARLQTATRQFTNLVDLEQHDQARFKAACQKGPQP